MASTTIVNVNSEQQDKLIEYLSGVVGTSLSKPANVTEFTAIMVTHADALIAGAEEKDVESCFQVLFKDIQLETNAAVATKLVTEVIKVITATTDSKPALRLRIAANLYNVLSSVASGSSGFVAVLLAIIKYAGTIGQIDMLQGYFELLDDLVLKWALSAEDAKSLFLQVSKALEAAGSAEKAQRFLIKYLSTFGVAASANPETKALAAQGAASAVRNPIVGFMERHNMLALPAVAALQSDPEHAKLHELLTIFSSGKLRDYKAFEQASPEVLPKYGLDPASCVASMRLLTMCSLATEHEEIPYKAIAAGLEVPLDEVEGWVVRTIGAKLIDARMDQLRETVLITRCTHRVFGKEQWLTLQQKLNAWKTNLKGILDTMAKTNALA